MLERKSVRFLEGEIRSRCRNGGLDCAAMRLGMLHLLVFARGTHIRLLVGVFSIGAISLLFERKS